MPRSRREVPPEPPSPPPHIPDVPPGFKSGTVVLIGEPNAGKSTLLNALLGIKVAIVSDKPQTTRERILGIVNRPGAQLLILDTPGMHESDKPLNRYMIDQARAGLKDADVIVWVIDAPHELHRFDPVGLAAVLARSGKPVIAAINKVDRIEEKPNLLPLMARIGAMDFPKAVYAVSALNRKGIDDLIRGMIAALPEGPAYYPADEVTDRPVRFLVSEIIREKVFEMARREVPYSCAVAIDSFQEKPEKNLIVVQATLYVEREGQKAILIGEQGRMIKRIGERARREIEAQFSVRAYLDLQVAVETDWSHESKGLRKLGYA